MDLTFPFFEYSEDAFIDLREVYAVMFESQECANYKQLKVTFRVRNEMYFYKFPIDNGYKDQEKKNNIISLLNQAKALK